VEGARRERREFVGAAIVVVVLDRADIPASEHDALAKVPRITARGRTNPNGDI